MSVTIYMTVTVENEEVVPSVHVSSFQRPPWQGEPLPMGPNMDDVRFGLEVAREVIDFAERLKAESS